MNVSPQENLKIQTATFKEIPSLKNVWFKTTSFDSLHAVYIGSVKKLINEKKIYRKY